MLHFGGLIILAGAMKKAHLLRQIIFTEEAQQLEKELKLVKAAKGPLFPSSIQSNERRFRRLACARGEQTRQPELLHSDRARAVRAEDD